MRSEARKIDCSFPTDEGIFNFRVGGVYVRDGLLLAMTEEHIDHYYLPGGRVRLHETMEEALRREAVEELGMDARILRPLWLCESFFSLKASLVLKRPDAPGMVPVHEIALYFLAELDWDSLPALSGEFRLRDTDGEEHIFRWLTPEEVRSSRIYPIPLKETFPRLPEELTFYSDVRDRMKD